MDSYLRRRLAENSGKPSGSFRPSLTISRQCGAGAERIGTAIADYLDSVDESAVQGWAVFDQSSIGKIIEGNRLPGDAPPYDPARTKFPISELLRENLSARRDEWTLFHHCANTVRSLCLLGNTVIIGRAGNFVTADLGNTFHVRLVGSEEKRTGSVETRYRMSRPDAIELVDKVDRSRSNFVKRHADADIDDERAYHLVVNTDDLSDGVIVRIIGDSILEWAYEAEQRDDSSDLGGVPKVV